MNSKNIKANDNGVNTNPGNFVHYGRMDYQVRERFTRKGGDKVFLRLMRDRTDSRGKDIIVLEDEVTKPEFFVENSVNKTKKVEAKTSEMMWVTPDSKIYQTNNLTHIDWIAENITKIKDYVDTNILNKFIDEVNKGYDYDNNRMVELGYDLIGNMLSKGWVRVNNGYIGQIAIECDKIIDWKILDKIVQESGKENIIIDKKHDFEQNMTYDDFEDAGFNLKKAIRKINAHIPYHEVFIHANVNVEDDESNMVEWAKKELELLGMYNGDEMNEKLADSIIYMLREFGKVGHSGSSAWWTADILNRLLNWKNLSPLTPNKDEWMDITDMCDGNVMYQSKRNPACFTTDFKTFYDVDKKRNEKGGIDNPWSFEEEMSGNEVEASVDEILYPAWWISPNNNIFIVQEDDVTHADWAADNLDIVGKYSPNAEHKIEEITEDEDYDDEDIYDVMYDNEWTRIRRYYTNSGMFIEIDFANTDKLKYVEDLIMKNNLKFDNMGLGYMGRDILTVPKDYVMEEGLNLSKVWNKGKRVYSMQNSITNAWLSPGGKLYEFDSNISHQHYINKELNMSINEAFEKGWTRILLEGGKDNVNSALNINGNKDIDWVLSQLPKDYMNVKIINVDEGGEHSEHVVVDEGENAKIAWTHRHREKHNDVNNKVDSAMSTCVYDGDEFKTGTDELYNSMNIDNMKDLIYNPEFSRQLQLILQDKGNSKKPGKWGGSNLQLEHEEEHNKIFRDKGNRDKSNNLDDTMPPDIDLKHYTDILK